MLSVVNAIVSELSILAVPAVGIGFDKSGTPKIGLPSKWCRIDISQSGDDCEKWVRNPSPSDFSIPRSEPVKDEVGAMESVKDWVCVSSRLVENSGCVECGDGRESDAVSGFWRSGKGGPDGVSTVSPLLLIIGLSETTPGSRPARRASPTGRAISSSGLGAPPDLSRGISAPLTLSDQYVIVIG